MIFGYEKEKLEEMKAIFTATEIAQQPTFWGKTYDLIAGQKDQIKGFLNKKVQADTRIVFTGAGTSDYVGDTIVNYVNKISQGRVEAIATTDIVSNPDEYIEENTKTILVSFARSGNSPESVGAYDLFQNNVKDITQLVITCNKEGALALEAQKNADNYVILLPDETNDKSFAMTSSFSCMMLSALLFFDIDRIEENRKYVDMICKQGEKILADQWQTIKGICGEEPKRIVYLGAGCFHGLVQELALKNMELTNGRIATIQESVLGFRHGPKTFMDDDTNIVVLMSQNEYTHLYEKDLLNEIHNDNGTHKLTVLSYKEEKELADCCDHYITVGGEEIPDVFAGFNYLLYGQMIGIFNSLQLKITPDNPSPDGTVNRVVKGVTIHPYKA